MSYYRPSYSQTVAMSRGRGFSSTRGSYRGNSRGGSSWGGSHRGYTPRGGRGDNRFSSFSGSYDPTRTKYSGPNDRYQSRSHTDDYRKPYKPDGLSGYTGGRDHGHRSSPDRKRMRTESVSSRHESYGGTSDGYGRYESSGGYSERRSFSGDRKSSSLTRSREDFRKPPPPPPPPSISSPRGSYRGRRISSRGGGSMRSRLRERTSGRRRLVDSSYAVTRRRIVTTRSTDYARRLKLRLRSNAIIRRSRRMKLSDKGDSDEKDKDDDDDEEEEEDEKSLEDVKDLEEREEDEKEDEESKEKKPSPKKSSPKKDDILTEKEDRKSVSEAEDKIPITKKGISTRSFIKLVCPHCQTKCPTFIKYSMHLQSSRHMSAMRKVALKQKSILGQLRLAQRTTQRELEKNSDDLAPRTNFCPLCKLNYKQPKSTHQASDSHKNMKRFLMPFCKICKITLKSPMIYENHCCSIEHLKRKQLMANGDKSDKEDGSGIDDDNLENFMTIDSVGDVDEEDSGDGKKKEVEGKPKEVINVGIENIRKIEVHYCDLCRMYLPRAEDGDIDKIISKHCKQRTHLQKYIRYKEDKELTKRAERLQRKETAEKERERDKSLTEAVKTDKTDKPEEETASKETETPAKPAPTAGAENEEEEVDDKIWDDVHKDIGDILDEATKFDDDEDEEDSVANGERYDRFRSGEKIKEEAKKVTEEAKPEEVEEEKPSADADEAV